MITRNWFVSAFLLASLCVPAFTQGRTRTPNFHVCLGLASPTAKNIKNGFQSGFGFSLPLSNRTAVAFEFDYWKSGVTEEPQGFLDGDLSLTPLFISFCYFLSADKPFTPYVFLGTGYFFANFKVGSIVTIPEVTITQKVSNGLGLHLGAGSSVKLTRNLALFGEAAYLYRKGGAETVITDMNFGISREKFDVDLSSTAFRFGIKYFI